MRRSLILAAAAVFVLVQTGAAGAADKIRVGKAVPYIFSFTPIEIGLEKGIYAKHGLEIENIGFQGGAKLHQGLIADVADIGLTSGADLAVVTRGTYAKAVGAMAGPPLLMGITVAYDSPIKTLNDLKGKKIGIATVGSLTHWLSLELARSRGWGPEGVEIVALGGSVPAQAAALKLHQVDALMESAAIGMNAEEKKEARLLAPVDYVKDFHIHMFYATTKFIAAKPDAIRRFLAAWFETMDYMRANKAETVRIARTVTNYSEAVENREYDAVMPMFSRDGKFDPKALATLSRSFVELKLLDTEPDLSKFITEEFLPKM